MLADKTVVELLQAFSSTEPTPGGGSASALAGAVGTALLLMVCQLPRTRANSDADRQALGGAAGALTAIRDLLTELVDRDSLAYEAVVAARRLPKGTDDEKASRTAATQQALRQAIETPLEVMRRCRDGLQLAETVAAHGNRSAASDVEVGVALLAVGLRGGRLNVDINVAGVTEEAYIGDVRTKTARLVSEGEAAAARARRHLAFP